MAAPTHLNLKKWQRRYRAILIFALLRRRLCHWTVSQRFLVLMLDRRKARLNDHEIFAVFSFLPKIIQQIIAGM